MKLGSVLLGSAVALLFSAAAHAGDSAAIAINTSTCNVGYSWAYDDLSDADSAAIAQAGGGGVVAWISNESGYVAIATGDGCAWGVSAPQGTPEDAESVAISECASTGAANCAWRAEVGGP